MHRTTRILAVPALLATLALGACGEETAPGGDPTNAAPTSSVPAGDTPTSTTAPSTAPTSQSPAPSETTTPSTAPSTDAGKASIQMTVSGGIAGVQQRYLLPSGSEPAKAFTLAQSPQVKAFQGKHINPRIADAFIYTLKITHADGATTSIVTNDGAVQPPEVKELINLLRTDKLLQPKTDPQTPPPAK